VTTHNRGVPPDVEKIGQTLSLSLEESHFLCRKLQKLGIIEIVEGAFGTKLFIKNHLALETLPQTVPDTAMKNDIDKFMSQKQEQFKEVESIKAKQDQKKKDLFSEIDQKLKERLKTPKPG
jgi:hypothetical protein